MTKVRTPSGGTSVTTQRGTPTLAEVLASGNDGGGSQINNIADPTLAQDALTLAYFNAHSSGFTLTTNGTSGAATFLAGILNIPIYSSGGGGSFIWGQGTGTLSNQTDLQNALNTKLNVASPAYTGTLTTGTLGYSDVNILASFQSSVNNYNQIILQNTSNGNTASANWNVSNDQGTASTNFGEFGINSSGFTGTSIFSQAGYVYLASATTDLVIGTYGNKPIHFVVNSGSSDAFTVNASGTSTFGSTVNLSANTTSAAPLLWKASGANLTTSPTVGMNEVDSIGMKYYTHATGERGVELAEQFITLTSPYTLVSQTGAQKLFNSTSNGAVTLASTTSYYFECMFTVTSLSASSGSFGFGFGGTAVLTSQYWKSLASKSTNLSAGSGTQTTDNTASNTALFAANTSTLGGCFIKGIVRIATGGTLIPQISFTTVAGPVSPIVGTDSWFKIYPIGNNTVTTVGNWS